LTLAAAVPDETTVCRFRHLLEAHDLGRRLFGHVPLHLAAKGLKVATGTIVDATIDGTSKGRTQSAQWHIKGENPKRSASPPGSAGAKGTTKHALISGRSVFCDGEGQNIRA
jgi:IS5 family transposase